MNAEALMGTNFEASLLIKKVLTQQFKLPPSFGGVGKQTGQEDWRRPTPPSTRSRSASIPGKLYNYVWQFRIGFCDSSDVLFCRGFAETCSLLTRQ